jgi:hypothetical protein
MGTMENAEVKEVFAKMHGHQKKTLALLVIGIVLGGSTVLQRVAEGLSLHGIHPAKMTSIERRLARFIANDRVVVSKVWQEFLSQVLPTWQGKQLRFVLDGTTIRADARYRVLRSSRALAGLTAGLGRNASTREMARETMEHCGSSA